ncbi:hypothetical protein NG2371_01843 [Nocardia gamkensis]|uniref:Uncharacterized protein n=1 Tax=Nocardia gamkensis TaxID=352869 RepID=A0A7X6L4Y9_9NOCA|nr:hypothetical protein [Nocardia gamkensis]NQE67391.1 hypothetical protein [Nocardia gamkensis]
MSGDDNLPRPLTNLVNDAREGRLLVRMDPEQFVYVDRDCEFFKTKIRDIQQMMTDIAQQQTWGLGEQYRSKSGNELVSGKTMVKRYREKARGSQNSVYAVMESHYRVVEDIQDLFRVIRERYSQQDAEWGARYRELEATLPPQAPAPQRIFSVPFAKE